MIEQIFQQNQHWEYFNQLSSHKFLSLKTAKLHNIQITSQTNKFLIKFINQYEYNKFQREINDKNKYAVLEREEFEEIIEDIAEVRCVNCTKEYCDCNIYPVLDYSLKLEGNGTEKNCKYAWRR